MPNSVPLLNTTQQYTLKTAQRISRQHHICGLSQIASRRLWGGFWFCYNFSHVHGAA